MLTEVAHRERSGAKLFLTEGEEKIALVLLAIDTAKEPSLSRVRIVL